MVPETGTPVDEAKTLSAAVALMLLDAAAGKYDVQFAWLMAVLRLFGLGKLAVVLKAMFAINKLTAPNVPVVADGRGGWVPSTNSRYDPKTGRFL